MQSTEFGMPILGRLRPPSQISTFNMSPTGMWTAFPSVLRLQL